MRTEHDLDEMLAEHQRRFDPGHRPDLPPAEPEPRPPRTTWPRGRQWANWPASTQAEFALWVRRLYHEQRLPAIEVAATLNVTARNVAAEAKRQGLWRQAIPAEERRPQIKALYEAHRGEISATDIARMLGIAVSTVNYDMQALGLTTQRDRTMAEAARRRARVKAIHAEHGGNITAVQIAGLLGVGDTTVVKDLHHLGLVRPPRKDVERMERTVDRALASMGDMAQLILDQEHLEHLEPDADRLAQWVSTIRRVSKAINSVRRHAKGESHG